MCAGKRTVVANLHGLKVCAQEGTKGLECQDADDIQQSIGMYLCVGGLVAKAADVLKATQQR